jgi:hypothetical protein
MADPLVIALGASCECTYQVRRFTGVERASYFDWLGVSHDALMAVLQKQFRGCFLKEKLTLGRAGTTVIDSATGVSYRHAFKWLPGSTLIDPDTVKEKYEEQREKYAALTDRWFEDIRSRHVLFVRHDSPTASQLQELLKMLAFYCQRRFELLLISDPASREQLKIWHPALTIEYADTRSSDESAWQGSDDVWNQILGGHLKPKMCAFKRRIVARDLTRAE